VHEKLLSTIHFYVEFRKAESPHIRNENLTETLNEATPSRA